MNSKEYIDSGILESVVLGICTAEEMQEAECMARIFPEVKQELESLRASFEKVALANKVEPPAGLKAKLFAAIEQEASKTSAESKIISFESRKQPAERPALKYYAAASVAVAIISIFSAFLLSQKKNSLTTELNQLKSERQLANKKYDELSKRVEEINAQAQVMMNPEAAHVVLKGTAVSPQSVATVYWNKKSSEVYIAVNSLPAPPPGKQYQLWGIVQGAPVDLGVFDILPGGDSLLQKMKTVTGATTFAVTLEKAGGSPAPTLEAMYLAGNI